jgi:hypothetical protein
MKSEQSQSGIPIKQSAGLKARLHGRQGCLPLHLIRANKWPPGKKDYAKMKAFITTAKAA